MIARVFPRRTSYTPTDENAFVGEPPLGCPQFDEVHISTVFTWDIPETRRLANAWQKYSKMPVIYGGPAFGDAGGEFVAGKYLRKGITITSRGCCRDCDFCFVPKREGKIRTLPIQAGNIIQDNNLLACPRSHIEAVFEMLKTQKAVEFKGGLDCRLLKRWHIDLLRKLPSIKNIWIAYDNPENKLMFKRAMQLLGPYFNQHKVYAYVLIGYKKDQISYAEARCRFVYECGAMPFAMLYCGESGKYEQGYEWRLFQRTWSRPAAINAMMKGKRVTT